MSSRQFALTGEVDNRDAMVESLTADNRRMARELSELKAELQRVMRENGVAIGELRKVLTPLYRRLQQVFGEMEAIAGAEYQAAPSSKHAGVWESWKARLGEGPAKCIDALMMHPMNTQQLAIATGYHRTTIPAHIHKLNKAGLINKSGGVFSLKDLG